MRETERETERERDRERERQSERKGEREIDRQTDRQTDRQGELGRGKHPERQKQRQLRETEKRPRHKKCTKYKI